MRVSHSLLDILTETQRTVRPTVAISDDQVVADETRILTENHYFRNEMLMLLEKAGFTVEAEKGDWTGADATAEHDVIVYFARR